MSWKPILQRTCSCEGGAEPCNCPPEEELQRKADGTATNEVPSVVHDVLGSPGRSMGGETRGFMEARFGHDFGMVRVHDDARAARSAKAVRARAYTVGSDVVFGSGGYRPGTAHGRRLLAHELTHVIQQDGGHARLAKMDISSPGDPAEREADEIADRIASGESVRETRERSSSVMREIELDGDCDDRREEAEGNLTRAQASASRWCQTALDRLRDPTDAATLLRRHFGIGADREVAVAHIRRVYQALIEAFNGDIFRYHCRPDSDSRCTTEEGEQVAGFVPRNERGEIFFCHPYPYQDFFGHRSLIDTLLHEAAHSNDVNLPFQFNHDTYEHEDGYPPANALTNADSYSAFAREAARGGGRHHFAPDLTLGQVTGAEPQFYISAGLHGDLGGPVLDLVNLRMGARLFYTPGSETTPHRFGEALDLGLRFSPTDRRLYVDVTTGAFFGVNITDEQMMFGIASRVSAGYRGDTVDFGLELSHFYDLIGDENMVVVGVRGAARF